tara:strand:- start:8216 stop:8518 length:303 start_codon:yes stop_codon:yes gene_type:complete
LKKPLREIKRRGTVTLTISNENGMKPKKTSRKGLARTENQTDLNSKNKMTIKKCAQSHMIKSMQVCTVTYCNKVGSTQQAIAAVELHSNKFNNTSPFYTN